MSKKNPLLVILGISAIFFVVFVVIAVSTTLSLTTGGKPDKKFFAKSSSIGVLEINGVIMDSKKNLEQIESFEEDPLIKAVVVRINSPGGAVAPSQEIYNAIHKLSQKKPVYASMSSVAASGGYYVACGAKKIFANPGTLTGSIGVIMQFADLSKLYQWAKVSPYNIKTGKYKDIGSPNREMTAEEKTLLQGMIDNVLSQFRKTVAASRGLTLERVVELSDGRIFSGEQAKDVKLVDELGGITEAVEALAKEVGISGKPHLVYPSKHKHYLEKFFSDLDDDEESESSSIGSVSNWVNHIVEKFVDIPSSSHKLIGPLFMLPRTLQ